LSVRSKPLQAKLAKHKKKLSRSVIEKNNRLKKSKKT